MRTPEVTAQVANGDEAYVALRCNLVEPGPSGEVSVAEIWHTVDRGRSWRVLSWRRAASSFLPRSVFAGWPPEWVNRIWLTDSGLEIEVREDGGWGSPADPIWRATWNGARWRVRFERYYHPEVDGAIAPPSLDLDLPGITTPPVLGPYW